MKWGSGRKEHFLSPGNRAECFSSLRTILCSIYATDHLQSSVFISSSDLPSKAIGGAGLQPPLPCPWLSLFPGSPVSPCGLPRGQPVVCFASAKNILAHFPDLLPSLPPHCHVLLASSLLLTGRKIWRQEPRGGEKRRRRTAKTIPFPLLFPLQIQTQSKHNNHLSAVWTDAAVTVTRKHQCAFTLKDRAVRKPCPLLLGVTEGKWQYDKRHGASFGSRQIVTWKTPFCLSLMTLKHYGSTFTQKIVNILHPSFLFS